MSMEAMPLQTIIERLTAEGLLHAVHGDVSDVWIRDLQYDSREVTPGCLFLCKGARFNPNYIAAARVQGAVAVLADRVYEEAGDLPMIQVNDIRRALAVSADVFFHSPWRTLNMIGVTGTKGKSTTVTLLKAIFDEAALERKEKPAGLTSSLRIYDGRIDAPAVLTTPENVDLYRHLHHAVSAGLRHMIVEVSSQALKYGRVAGLHFNHGVFLNIAPDHISPVEHPDFDDYFASKRMLFAHCDEAYVNLDSDGLDLIRDAASPCGHLWTFGYDDVADVRATDVRQTPQGLAFTVQTPATRLAVRLPMHGHFNVENALAAIAVADRCGVAGDTICAALEKVSMPGHMIYIKSRDVTVVVDFAHNEISFRQVFAAAEQDFPGVFRTVVFGAPGNKAESRRAGMGEVASAHADRIYLTADDPAREGVSDINRDIRAAYVRPTPTCEVPDREAAIRDAILSAPPGSLVLLLGKGNEDRQKVGHGSVPYEGDEALAHAAIDVRTSEGRQPSIFFPEAT